MVSPRHSQPAPSTTGAADGGSAGVTVATIANEGERSAETAIERDMSRSSEKLPENAGEHSLTVSSPVDHKGAFSLELIWNRAGTIDGIDWRRHPALDSD